MGVAPSKNYMGHHGLFILQKGYNFVDVEIIIAQRYIDLIQKHHVIALIQNQLLSFGPSRLCHFGVTGFVLGFPSEAFAHSMKRA